MMQLLFYTRLFLYLLAFGIPVIHPSIAIPYDRVGWWMWFFLLPGEMLISFYLSPPRFRVRTWILSGGGFLLLSIVLFSGFSSYTLLYIGAGISSFLLTALIFKTGTRGQPFAVMEQFFLGFLYYKMLNFSRASESVARQSSGITQAILILIIFSFLLHGMVIYLSAYRNRSEKGKVKEPLLLLGIAVPVVLLIVLLLPPDFVTHSVVFNILKQDQKPKPIPLDVRGEGLLGGNLLSNNRWKNERTDGGRSDGFQDEGLQDGEGESAEGEAQLEGVPSDRWNNQGAGGDNKQYAVMIIASSMDPVYAADAYFSQFDAERGFLLSGDQPMNDLTHIRLLDTWEDRGNLHDLKRYPQSIFYLSTLSERVLAYRPHRIEPTVLDRKYHPFDYSYDTVSMISHSSLADWTQIKALSEEDRESLKSYLEVTLTEDKQNSFESYLVKAIQGKSGYFEKVFAIFESFSSFQYELGFQDDVSVVRMEEFLMEKRRGDCTEFSNATAILARLTGVPSRVVTGYLASRNLQTFAHRRGILILRQIIDPLKSFPIQNLYLVTTAHRHSWVQLYLPGYGWVDFDPTTYAIPPAGIGNPNSMDVVIPLIQIEDIEPLFQFPWQLAGQFLFILLIGMLIALYLYRYVRELYLHFISSGQSQKALRALYTLLLMRLSVNGYAFKSPSQTPLEYSKSYPELNRFASLYTKLRFREQYAVGERASLWNELNASYREVSSHFRKPGIINVLRRLISLKGLYYR